jgi:hypothetical protein
MIYFNDNAGPERWIRTQHLEYLHHVPHEISDWLFPSYYSLKPHVIFTVIAPSQIAAPAICRNNVRIAVTFQKMAASSLLCR